MSNFVSSFSLNADLHRKWAKMSVITQFCFQFFTEYQSLYLIASLQEFTMQILSTCLIFMLQSQKHELDLVIQGGMAPLS